MFFVVRSNDSFNFPLRLIKYIVIVSYTSCKWLAPSSYTSCKWLVPSGYTSCKWLVPSSYTSCKWFVPSSYTSCTWLSTSITSGVNDICPVATPAINDICLVATPTVNDLCPRSAPAVNDLCPVATPAVNDFCPVVTPAVHDLLPVSHHVKWLVPGSYTNFQRLTIHQLWSNDLLPKANISNSYTIYDWCISAEATSAVSDLRPKLHQLWTNMCNSYRSYAWPVHRSFTSWKTHDYRKGIKSPCSLLIDRRALLPTWSIQHCGHCRNWVSVVRLQFRKGSSAGINGFGIANPSIPSIVFHLHAAALAERAFGWN